jgi:hypothetical protein
MLDPLFLLFAAFLGLSAFAALYAILIFLQGGSR